MIAVIGCGNTNRRDDGAGPEVIRILKARGLERDGVKLFDAGTDDMAVMFEARGCTRLIIIDAAQNCGEPGTVYEVPGAELERPYTPGLNLHDFRWDAALHAGRQIFREAFPSDVAVFLIAAQDLGLGLELTEPVAAAAARVADRIAATLAPPLQTVELRRGNLYLSRELCALRFGGLESVALLRNGRDLLVMPVHSAAAGGFFLKQRNSAGDRIIEAPDFFRAQGVADDARSASAIWDDSHAALIVSDIFANLLSIEHL